MNARATRFPLFDSLRAIAALMILGTHALAAASGPYFARLSYVVERPALRLKRLVGPPREQAPGEATAEPAPAGPMSAPRPG